jgi:hypothetical protein
MISFDSGMRRQALTSIHGVLTNLVMQPPRVNNRHSNVDAGKIRQELSELQPFWDAYLSIAKPREHTFSLGNMQAGERDMYLSCEFWWTLLELLVKESDKP